jgi:hypothetical protein
VEISEDFYFDSIRCHEAAHAVVWWDSDIDVETIDVWKSGLFTFETRGLVIPGDIEDNMRGWCVGIAAGSLAQVRFFIEHGLTEAQAERITDLGSWGDDQSLAQACGRLGFSQSYIRSLASASLERRWGVVGAVAEALDHNHHLPGSVAR